MTHQNAAYQTSTNHLPMRGLFWKWSQLAAHALISSAILCIRADSRASTVSPSTAYPSGKCRNLRTHEAPWIKESIHNTHITTMDIMLHISACSANTRLSFSLRVISRLMMVLNANAATAE